MWGETTRVENRGETTRGETTRGETSWGRNVLLPLQMWKIFGGETTREKMVLGAKRLGYVGRND